MNANTGTEEASDDDRDGIMSNLEIDADANDLFKGFSMVTNGYTKSYLEAYLTTPTQDDRSVTSGKSSEALYQHKRSTPMSYILRDNQSIVEFFCNPNSLWNIRASDWILHPSCNAGTIPVNQVSDLPGYGRV